MPSLFDELNEKVKRTPGLTKRNMPRADLGLLLYNARDDLRSLWLAAESERARAGSAASTELIAALERLRPIFGARP